MNWPGVVCNRGRPRSSAACVWLQAPGRRVHGEHRLLHQHVRRQVQSEAVHRRQRDVRHGRRVLRRQVRRWKCTAQHEVQTTGNPHGQRRLLLAACRDGICSPAPSFCAQEGDACSTDPRLLRRSCAKAAGGARPRAASSRRRARAITTAGTVCTGATTEARCRLHGGDWLQQVVPSFAASGVLQCQPPTGCHPTGELCQQDSDCCGAPGAPVHQGTPAARRRTHCSKRRRGRRPLRSGQARSPAGSILPVGDELLQRRRTAAARTGPAASAESASRTRSVSRAAPSRATTDQ